MLYLATLGNASILRLTIRRHVSVTNVGSFSNGNQFGEVTLFAGSDGNIYGLAFRHGNREGGELFQVTPSIGALASFDKTLRPDSIIAGKGGYFYGTSEKGGAHGLGALLRYKPGRTSIDLLYSFTGAGDGAYPSTPLMLHSDGYYYGMTLQASMRSNGRASLGRVFRFRPPQ